MIGSGAKCSVTSANNSEIFQESKSRKRHVHRQTQKTLAPQAKKRKEGIEFARLVGALAREGYINEDHGVPLRSYIIVQYRYGRALAQTNFFLPTQWTE